MERALAAVALVLSAFCVDALRKSQKDGPDIYMLSFGAGDGFEMSERRLAKEASATGLFDKVVSYRSFPDFIKNDRRWAEHMQHKTGNGFWFWKAPLAKQLMNEVMKDGDILVYLDGGSELGNMSEFREVTSRLCDHDILAYALSWTEQQLTKGDVFKRFGMSVNDAAGPQLLATYYVIKNSKASRSFVAKWESLAADLSLIGDSKSSVPNHASFHAHRRDQSLFSMLVKANKPAVEEGLRQSFPRALIETRHQEFGIQDFRPFIARDPGYPQNPKRHWISASRIRGKSEPRFGDGPTHLSKEDVDSMKRLLTMC